MLCALLVCSLYLKVHSSRNVFYLELTRMLHSLAITIHGTDLQASLSSRVHQGVQTLSLKWLKSVWKSTASWIRKNGHLWVTCNAVLKWNMVIWIKSSPNVLTQAQACLTLHVQLFDNCLLLGQRWNLGRQQSWAVTPGWQQSPGGLQNNSKCITSAKCKTPPSLFPSLVRHLRATYLLVKTNFVKRKICAEEVSYYRNKVFVRYSDCTVVSAL